MPAASRPRSSSRPAGPTNGSPGPVLLVARLLAHEHQRATPSGPGRTRSGSRRARDGSRGSPRRPRGAPSGSSARAGTAWRRSVPARPQARFARVAGPLLVVDAPSMLFRAFYALPDTIKGADGRPVNALLGTANLILREVEQHEPRAVVLCFGPDAADYRVELFDGYHAERPGRARHARAPVPRCAPVLRGVRLDRRRQRLVRGRRPARLVRDARDRGAAGARSS